MTHPRLLRIILLLVVACFMGACAGPAAPKTKARKVASSAELSRKPEHDVTKTAKKRMYVRTTAYHHSEPGGRVTAVGGYLRATHSAAADWSWLPAGTRFRIVETGEDYIIEDYGSALVGKYTIDLYKSTRGEMNRWGVRYEIIEMGSYKVSLAVLKPRQKYWHVRAMVQGLLKKV